MMNCATELAITAAWERGIACRRDTASRGKEAPCRTSGGDGDLRDEEVKEQDEERNVEAAATNACVLGQGSVCTGPMYVLMADGYASTVRAPAEAAMKTPHMKTKVPMRSISVMGKSCHNSTWVTHTHRTWQGRQGEGGTFL